MGQCPEGLTLERKDNSNDYTPYNCKWATWKEQAGNRRPKPCNPDSLMQRCKNAAVPYIRVVQRIRAGWTEEKAMTTPIIVRKKYVSVFKREIQN
jgi:hypothetical protein